MTTENIHPWDELKQTHAALLGHARAYADLGFAAVAEELGRHWFPPRLADTPLVLDTDIGGDPDDAVALAVAARHLPQLALVVTSDEHDGQRARFARYLLDLLDRPDVPVVAGRELHPADRLFCVDGLIPSSVPAPGGDPVAALARLLARTEGPARWLGCGPMSNLADITATRPDLAARLVVTQMGGALAYRDPTRGQRNIRRDVPAAVAALRAHHDHNPTLVTSEITTTAHTAITADSALYRQWADQARGWAGLLAAHFDRWFTRHHRDSKQHDPLTLAAAIELPFIDLGLDRIAFDDIGRMRLDPAGVPVFYSTRGHYRPFQRWLAQMLDPNLTPPWDRAG